MRFKRLLRLVSIFFDGTVFICRLGDGLALEACWKRESVAGLMQQNF
jgi:hypothetical protein